MLVKFHKRRRRRVQAVAVLGAATMAGLAVGAYAWMRPGSEGFAREVGMEASPPGRDDAPVGSRTILLGDGSTAEPLTVPSQLVLVEVSSSRVQVRLDSGAARFRVAHSPQRAFVVLAGAVQVTALGTDFSVERADARARVSVAEGQVRVSWAGDSAVLAASEERWFPPLATPVPPAPPAPSAAPPAPPAPPAPSAAPKATEPSPPAPPAPAHPRRSWRAMAQEGRYAEAYLRLKEVEAKGGSDAVRDEPHDLFLAADSARLSGHPEQAIPYLDKLLDKYAGDARAPLAAFTLGRILLSLGRPVDAAPAFHRARKLSADGALDEDALAREAESWFKAGNRVRARSCVEEYLKLYPNGARREALERGW